MNDDNRLIEELEFQIKNCKDFGHSDIYIDVDIAKEICEKYKKVIARASKQELFKGETE